MYVPVKMPLANLDSVPVLPSVAESENKIMRRRKRVSSRGGL